MPQPLNCPVCNARLRGSSICSRCGADLTLLMTLVARSLGARCAARRALGGGDIGRACELARQAQYLFDTPVGRKLKQFTADLVRLGRMVPILRPT